MSLSSEYQSPTAHKKRLVLITVAALVALLIGMGGFFLFNGGPSSGTLTGNIELTNPGATVPKLISGHVDVEVIKPGRIETFISVRTIPVGSSGHFKVSLPPGQYYLEGSGIFHLSGQSQQASTGIEVTIQSGQTTYVPFQINVTGLG